MIKYCIDNGKVKKMNEKEIESPLESPASVENSENANIFKDENNENNEKKKKFKKVKLTTDMKNKIEYIQHNYKETRWQTLKNLLNNIQDLNESNPKYIEMNLDTVNTIIINGLQNSRTAISRQSIGVLAKLIDVQQDNLINYLPQYFDILLSRLTNNQQFIVDESLNVVYIVYLYYYY